MTHTRVLLGIMLFLLPIGVLLLLAVPKIRATVHISRRAQLLLSITFLAIMVIAFVAQTVTEGHFLLYETVVLVGMCTFVAVRIERYRTRRKS
jgi:hypothetical protein